MSKNAASEDKLGQLHAAVATVLSNAFAVVQKQQEEYLSDTAPDDLPPDVPAALVSVAVAFLKNNNVVMSTAGNEAVDRTRKAVEAAKAARGNKVVSLNGVTYE